MVLSLWLDATEPLSSSSLVDRSNDIVVSIASYGPRLRIVHRTVHSIGRGSILPSRLMLWIDEGDEVPPRRAKRLEKRGLEVRYSKKELGPHKKYFPFTQEYPEFSGLLITADDDVLYPKKWIAGFIAKQRQSGGNSIVAYRSYSIPRFDFHPPPYHTWQLRVEPDSRRAFFTGVSGVAYPARFLDEVRAAGSAFMSTCPRADDVWLNAIAIRGAFAVHQTAGTSRQFLSSLGSQSEALWKRNVGQNENDSQIRAVFTDDILDRLSKQ